MRILLLEAIFSPNSPSIHQVYLDGNSLRAYHVAVVVLQQGEAPFSVCVKCGNVLQDQIMRMYCLDDVFSQHALPSPVVHG